jgi:hypothetical protein
VVEEAVDENYDPTADFLNDLGQVGQQIEQQQQQPHEVVSNVPIPIPEGAIIAAQGEAIHIEMPQADMGGGGGGNGGSAMDILGQSMQAAMGQALADDLDISDSDDEDEDVNVDVDDKITVVASAAPPLVPEPPPPDEDGIWF